MRIFVWNYMDPVKYPNPVDPKHTRVLYSEAYGTIAKNGTPVVDGTGKAPLVHVTSWGSDRLDGMQLTYGVNAAPDPRMGDSSGGANTAPHGGSFAVGPSADSRGDITSVSLISGNVPEAIGFEFQKGGVKTNTGSWADRAARLTFPCNFPA